MGSLPLQTQAAEKFSPNELSVCVTNYGAAIIQAVKTVYQQSRARV